MSKLGLFSSCGMKCGGRWSIPRKWHYICLVWYTHMIHKHSYFCGLAIEASDHRVTVSKYFLYKLGELGGAGPISKGLPQPLHILCTYVPGWAISCRTQQWQQKIHCRAPVLASFSPIGQSTSSSLSSHFCMSRESSDVPSNHTTAWIYHWPCFTITYVFTNTKYCNYFMHLCQCSHLLSASFPTVVGLVTAFSGLRKDARASSVCLTARALLQGSDRWAVPIILPSSSANNRRCVRSGPTAVFSTEKGPCEMGAPFHTGFLG